MPRGESLNDSVYRRLKNEILLCRLAPGEEVSEALIVERYHVSKAPLRSALTRLRQEQLVLSRGRLGNVVAPITVQDVHEVFHLRLVLEVEATRLAAGRVEAERLRALEAEVEAAHAAGLAGADENARERYREANHAFHRYVAEASGSARLARLVLSLSEQHERIVHFSLSRRQRGAEFHHVHGGLTDALIAPDADRAAALTEAAIRGSQTKILELFLAGPAPLNLAPEA